MTLMKNIPRPHPKAAGFTLMEIMLVLMIIALLVGFGVGMMKNVGGQAERQAAAAGVRNWETNLIRYKTEALIYPTTAQGLQAMVTKPTSDPVPRRWMQFADANALNDPWGRKFQYRNPGRHNPSSYDVFSLGPDGIEGTEDDIGNW